MARGQATIQAAAAKKNLVPTVGNRFSDHFPRDHVQRYLIPDGTRDRLNTSIMARLKAGISSGLRLDTRFPSTTAS